MHQDKHHLQGIELVVHCDSLQIVGVGQQIELEVLRYL